MQYLHRRSIPACAGEPAETWARSPWRWVYPRVCGGTTKAPDNIYHPGGLSPRVRGNPVHEDEEGQSERSIPACAGEPSPLALRKAAIWVYPRVCGGTVQIAMSASLWTGLSPRVRGNRPDHLLQQFVVRSIPACAGEPLAWYRNRSQRQVYPRVCGGTRVGDPNLKASPGLSPRVRGNHRF